MVQDWLREPQVVLSDEEQEGGINIDAAKQRMKQEDQFDKQLYREKVKQKHKVSQRSRSGYS